MKVKILSLALMSFVTVSIVGCQNMSNQDVGTVTGAVAGGLLGSRFGGGSGQVLATAAGTLAGAYIGGMIGSYMDDVDHRRMTQTMETYPVGKPAYIQGNQTGHSYEVVPTKNVTLNGNPYCREFQMTATIAGKKDQPVYGTACRQPDGSWKFKSLDS